MSLKDTFENTDTDNDGNGTTIIIDQSSNDYDDDGIVLGAC